MKRWQKFSLILVSFILLVAFFMLPLPAILKNLARLNHYRSLLKLMVRRSAKRRVHACNGWYSTRNTFSLVNGSL
jgi:hypothetical protein